MTPTPSPVGRPRSSSPAAIAEAATELFLENGYEATTVEQITRRVGVSRNTFFNYFEAKSDLLWYGFDNHLADVDAQLATQARPATRAAAIEGIEGVLCEVAGRFHAREISPAFNQAEAMGIREEFRASAHQRLTRLERALLLWLPGDLPDLEPPQRRLLATAGAATLLIAVEEWTLAGPARGPLEGYVRSCLALLRPAHAG